MADTKGSALTADTAPASTDELVSIKDPGGTPLSRRVTHSTVARRGFGMIYTTAGASPQTLSATTWTKAGQWLTNHTTSEGVTNDASNNKLTITVNGEWEAAASLRFTGPASAIISFAIYVGGVISTIRTGMTLSSTDTDEHSVSLGGVFTVASQPTDVELYVYVSGAGDYELLEGNLRLTRQF